MPSTRISLLLISGCCSVATASVAAPIHHLEIGANVPERLLAVASGERKSEPASAALKFLMANKPDKLWLFEPNPLHKKNIARLVSKYSNGTMAVEHVQAAAWHREEDMTFNIDKNSAGIGSSLFNGTVFLQKKWRKRGWRINNTLETVVPVRTSDHYATKVRALDLAEWMKTTLPPNARLTARFDIEGAEYVVLRHLMLQNLLCRFEEIELEGHALINGEQHAPFRMFEVLLPWLLHGCAKPPKVSLERYYGTPKSDGHEQRIEWTDTRRQAWCYSCPLLDEIVDPSLE